MLNNQVKDVRPEDVKVGDRLLAGYSTEGFPVVSEVVKAEWSKGMYHFKLANNTWKSHNGIHPDGLLVVG